MFLYKTNEPMKPSTLALLESVQASPSVDVLGLKIVSVRFNVNDQYIESFTFVIGENSYTATKKWKDTPCVNVSEFFRWEIKGISLRHDNDLEITKKELEKVFKEIYPKLNVSILHNNVRCYIKKDIEEVIVKNIKDMYYGKE